jgi:hypothetical protein
LENIPQFLLENILPVVISSIVSVWLFRKQKESELTKDQFIYFYFPAYKLIRKYLYFSPEKEDIPYLLEKLIQLAQKNNNEYLVGMKMMDLIYKCQVAIGIEDENTKTWAKMHKAKTMALYYGNEIQYFKYLCLRISISYHYKCDRLRIPRESFFYLNFKEKVYRSLVFWLTKFSHFCLIISTLTTIFLFIRILSILANG